ncbi:hypothetical protein Q2490_16855 [Myroides odoratimimus]|uniref:hypothetical protein n=1 Tax=Myroides odoratimimus TaxID=76832 RepID=UPI0026DF0BB1|nr:hypothetical protein [Myroides odoratimimus]MDO5858948.1 hypothetical protein [Myroides odoratimimus]
MDVKNFFENATFNEAFSTPSLEVLNLYTFNNITFSNYCPICDNKTTFSSIVNPNDITTYDSDLYDKSKHKPMFGGDNIVKTEPSIKVSETMYYQDRDNNRFIDYTFTVKCECQQCKKHNIFFLLNVQTKDACVDPFNSGSKFSKKILPGFIVSKKGIHPQQDLKLNKTVQKFLDQESRGWYYKGNKCLNEGLAIGAFAYFRRIIEKELLHIVEFVKKVNPSKTVEIDAIIKGYNEGGKKASIIYDGIFKYLPSSLQGLGDNPIKVLYGKTSGALHEYNEEKCTELSKSINKLLEFVIEKLYEEREQVSEIKNILKDLK